MHSEGLYIDIRALLPRVAVLRLPDQYRYAPLQRSPLGPGSSPETLTLRSLDITTTTAPVLLDEREIAEMMRLVRWNEHPAFDLRRALGMNSVKRAMAAAAAVREPPRQECNFAPARPAVRDADPVSFALHIRAQAWEWALGHIQILVFTTESLLDVEEGPESDSDSEAPAPAAETLPSAAPLELHLEESPAISGTTHDHPFAAPLESDVEESPTTAVDGPLREWPQPTSPRSAAADPSDVEWREPRSQAPTDRGHDPWTAFNTPNTKSKKTGRKVSTRRRDRENLPPSPSPSRGW